MKAKERRISALEGRIEAEPSRQLSVEAAADGWYREPASGRLYTAAELEKISDCGRLVVVLAPKPEGLEA
jgi:hypothetical protein